MRILCDRQWAAPLFALLLLLETGRASSEGEPVSTAAQELQAARMMQITLQAKKSGPAEWQKLDEFYQQLSKKYPGDLNVPLAHAEFLWETGQGDRAETLWKKVSAQDPRNAIAKARLAAAALASGDARLAADLYRQACDAEPGTAFRHFDLANVLFLFRHELLEKALPDAEAVIGKAMHHYAEACRLAPGNVDFARGYAETFYGQKNPDWQAALAAWQHLHSISPVKDFALANLANIYLKLGRKEDASACVAAMQSPDFATRKARLEQRIRQQK